MVIRWARVAKVAGILLVAAALAAVIIGYLENRPSLIDF
jgi:hypothetical protein